MNLRARIAIVVVAFVAIGGWYAHRHQKTPRTVTIVNPFAPARIDVVRGGETLASSTMPEATFTVGIPRNEETDDGLDPFRHSELEYRIDTPCGMQKMNGLDARPALRDGGAPDTTNIRVSGITSDGTLTVDNRKGPAHRVRVGLLEFEVAPDSILRQRYYVAEQCPPTMHVMIDGVDVGAVDSRGHAFVEPTGRRCYLDVTVKYGMPMFAGEPVRPQRMAPARLHQVSVLASVLESAPDRVSTIGLTSERHEVREVTCDE